MLKRLMVLVAALAALLVFAPTASAQGTLPEGTLPEACTGAIANPTELGACLDDLEATGGLDVPSECTTIVGNLPGTIQDPTGQLLACLDAITALDGEEDNGGEGSAATTAGYGYDGYSYDVGYDIGYDDEIPDGGVASGFGPTGSDAAGAPLVARGAALLAVLGVLATGLLIMRRRHGS